MNISQITSLFTLFSGEANINKYMPLIDSAVKQVSRKLKDEETAGDIRLDYLCAAIANYRYSQITCVKDRIAYTYGGTADCKGNAQMEYDLAKALMDEYYKAASDLLYDDEFIFSCVC